MIPTKVGLKLVGGDTVARLPIVVKLARRVASRAGRVRQAVADRLAWVRLEDARFDLETAREHGYFDEGYKYGLAAGRAEKLLRASPKNRGDEQGQLAKELRHRALASTLAPGAVVAVLLEVAWVLCGRQPASKLSRT